MSRLRPMMVLMATLLGTLALVSCLPLEGNATVDLSLLAGIWEGTNEYLDYQDDATRLERPTTLAVTLRGDATVAGPAEASLVFQYSEPSGANTTEETILRYFPTESLIEYGGNWAITESATDPQTGFLRLVFSGKGEDDGRPALVRHTIERQGDALTLRQEIRYDDATEFITRNEYRLRLSDQ